MPAGNPAPSSILSIGTTGDVERAHKACDEVGIAEGPLAQRVLWLIERLCPPLAHIQYDHQTVVRRGW